MIALQLDKVGPKAPISGPIFFALLYERVRYTHRAWVSRSSGFYEAEGRLDWPYAIWGPKLICRGGTHNYDQSAS